MFSVVVVVVTRFLVRFTQRRNISSLVHVYVTVGPHGIFMFVVSLFSVIGKCGDVEVLVPLETMGSQAFVHYFIGGLEVRRRPLLIWIGRMLDGGDVANEV